MVPTFDKQQGGFKGRYYMLGARDEQENVGFDLPLYCGFEFL